MIRYIQPLANQSDFQKLTELLYIHLQEEAFVKFLSFSLIPFDKATIEDITRKHKENGIDYRVYEKNNAFVGLLAYKRNIFQGFELFLLLVEKEYQRRGIGQALIEECEKTALQEHYKSMDVFVFADNKNMLRLLINNDFKPVDIQYHMRADGMDLIKLKKYL